VKKLLILFGRLFYWLWKLMSTGCLVFTNLVILAIVLVVLAVFFQPEIRVPDGSALIIEPRGDLVEEPTAINPVSRLFNGFAGIPLPQETLLQDILDAVNTAAEDDRIKILVLSLSRMKQGSLNQLHAIGQAVEAYKKSGKKVIAIDDQYTQSQYYLASYADEIYLNPMGNIGLRGFGIFRLYMKELLDKLAVTFHVFKVGSFKSATEPFLRNDMSEEAKVANRLWLTNLWDFYCRKIADNRHFSPELINTFINNMPELMDRAGGSASRMALEAGLIDGIKTWHEIEQYLSGLVGRSADDTSFKHIDFNEYMTTITPSFTENEQDLSTVGIIVARGNIIYGEDVPGQISSESLSKRIRRAGRDESVKALVLRIDSGGGSAVASEKIRQELLLFQQSGKPLVISMGGLAASGAYWISASADRIIASPVTLTGSIGIFGVLPTFEKSMAAIGIHSDGIATSKIAGGGNPAMALPPELSRTIQLSVEEVYDRFLNVVSEGRNIPRKNVEKLARGRVWDGTTARELGLVDELGNLDDAIAAAGKLAGLTDFAPLYIMETPSTGSEFLRQFAQRTFQSLVRQEFFRLKGSFLWQTMATVNKRFDFSLFESDPANVYAHSLIPLSAIAF
jgi:protease-4